MRDAYNAARIGSTIVESIIERDFRCSEVGNDRVSSAVETPRISDWPLRKKSAKTDKRVMRPTRMSETQPRFTSPRSVKTAPESLSTSRRGSGRWSSSSGSGLSTFQLEGSAESENCRNWALSGRGLDGGGHGVCRTLSTSDLVEPSYRESSWGVGKHHCQVGGGEVSGAESGNRGWVERWPLSVLPGF